MQQTNVARPQRAALRPKPSALPSCPICAEGYEDRSRVKPAPREIPRLLDRLDMDTYPDLTRETSDTHAADATGILAQYEGLGETTCSLTGRNLQGEGLSSRPTVVWS